MAKQENITQEAILPPHNIEAEEAVLGSILIDPDAFPKVKAIISADVFYRDKNGWILEAMEKVSIEGRAIDQITVTHKLREQGRLDSVGNAAYLSHLVSIIPTSLHAEYYAKIVNDCYHQRKLIQFASELAKKAYEGDKSDETVSWAMQEFAKLIQAGSNDAELMPIEDYLSNAEEKESLWGEFLFPEAIHLFSGEAGVGKTTFLYNLIAALTRGEGFLGFKTVRPLRVAYYDLESPKSLIKNRIALFGEVPEDTLFQGRTENLLADMPKIIHKVKTEHIEVVVFDPISMAFQTAKEEDNAEANRQMQAVRHFVQATGAAVILVHHLGKGTQSRSVHKARGASARPGAADVVINFEGSAEDVVKFEMAKNRFVGGVTTLFLKKVEGRFEITEVSGEQDSTEKYKAQEAIKQSLERGERHWDEIINLEGFSRATLQRALTNLLQLGEVDKPKRGIYSLKKVSTKYHADNNDTFDTLIPLDTNILTQHPSLIPQRSH